jgi:tRNA(His) 5'-end guanylyltransferase
MNHARKSMWEMLCRDRDLQAINAEKRVRGTMDAEINNVIYMELYSGPKMAHGKYRKMNVAGSID